MFFAPDRSLFNLFMVSSFLDDLRNLRDRAAGIASALVLRTKTRVLFQRDQADARCSRLGTLRTGREIQSGRFAIRARISISTDNRPEERRSVGRCPEPAPTAGVVDAVARPQELAKSPRGLKTWQGACQQTTEAARAVAHSRSGVQSQTRGRRVPTVVPCASR